MRHGKSGFTAIELLVVIGIIVILMAMLVPGLARGREAARSALCANNLRQMGIAFQMYLNDSRGIYPPFRLPKRPDGTSPLVDMGNGKKIRPRMPAGLGRYIEDAFDSPSATNERQNYDNPVLSCPTVPEWIDERNFAYGYNYQFLGCTRPRLSDPSQYVNYPVTERSVTRATRTVLMADCMGTAAAYPASQRLPYQPKAGPNPPALGNHGYALDPPRLPAGNYVSSDPEVAGKRSAIDPRHNGRGNILFCDGHVQGMTLVEAGYDVLADGTVTHNGNNRLFSGDGTDRLPATAD